jgi:hypothetical protein
MLFEQINYVIASYPATQDSLWEADFSSTIPETDNIVAAKDNWLARRQKMLARSMV